MNTCIVCGQENNSDHNTNLPNTFTAYTHLQTGDNICNFCFKFLRSSQDYRRNSWLWFDNEIRFFRSRSEILECLLSPPDSNFMIYITKTRKKQGFINLLNRINFSNNAYWVAFDDDLIFIKKKLLYKLFDFIKELRNEYKLSKTELKTGILRPKSYERISFKIQKKLKKLADNKLWLLLVYLID